jgi:hypothetical protein
MTDRNNRIRESAYFLRLEEGRPEDAAERHWPAAEGLLDEEPLEGKPTGGKTPAESKKGVPSITGTAGSD